MVMTRTKDERLADSQVEDLKARVELIDKESPALAGKRKRTTDFLFCALEGGKESSRGNADRAEKFRSGACQRD